ncbi:pentatricopeptide repeat-containing protein At1g26900, mitochondrial-like [Coffea eugenioides]|uniref:pentatricopeptide repeat-containing protein At1g26900, mitochondrial-like n=1 Tax=Coffea eugenioides TaxID=49369 RepID=UPI000F607A17|nr:pentatricopeptide repeat-containing protein At1g26900, mitochondrial-like [Coffea eugenioides]
MGEARKLFDEIVGRRDLISWNILMGGYLCASQNYLVVDLFRQLCTSGQIVGKTTILSVILVAGELNCVMTGDVVLRNCLTDGYAKGGLLDEALDLLGLMKLEEVKPNASTLAGLLSACASSGALALHLGSNGSLYGYIMRVELVGDSKLAMLIGKQIVDICNVERRSIRELNKMVEELGHADATLIYY